MVGGGDWGADGVHGGDGVCGLGAVVETGMTGPVPVVVYGT